MPYTVSVMPDAEGRGARMPIRTAFVSSAARYYEVGCDLFGDAVQLTMSYTGLTPPTFQFIGVRIDEAAGR
jgi:hypothetical protein